MINLKTITNPLSNKKASVMLIMTYVFLLIILLLGYYVDINGAKLVKADLQAVADAGALAGAQAKNIKCLEDKGPQGCPTPILENQARQNILMVIRSNNDKTNNNIRTWTIELDKMQINQKSGLVTVSIKTNKKTSFLGMIGINNLPITQTSSAGGMFQRSK